MTISRRDAVDRVSSVVDPRRLSALLAKATRAGDEGLARAIAERATEVGDADTMNAFLSGRPHLEQAGERLWNSQQQDDMAVISLGFQLMPAKPGESGSTQEWEIDRLAHQEFVA